MTGSEISSNEQRVNLLDGLIYADVFNCAPTLDELWRYSRVSIDREVLARKLREDPLLGRIVLERDGLYCLDDRPTLPRGRRERIDRARALSRRGRRVARLLRHAPFVRGLALTGSVAADDAGGEADVDMLVTVAPGRIGTVFLLLGSVSRLLRRRLFCPNYYVRPGSLGASPANAYLARELAQLCDVVTDGEPDPRHAWLGEVFPNARPRPGIEPELRSGTRLQRLLELLLRGALGGRLERVARRIALARLRVHYSSSGEEIPIEVRRGLEAGEALRFHRGHIEERTLRDYQARRAEVASRLRRMGRARVAPDESRA
jgi:predicted nucleotidyltransferase